jgi:hypothetical protein
MDVAAHLDRQGDAFRANAVRSVCKSLSTARVTMAVLHRDNARLRDQLRAAGLAPDA